MAAALTKNTLSKVHRHHILFKRTTTTSPDPKNISNRIHQSKWRFRVPYSTMFRRTKEMDFNASKTITSNFCSQATTSSSSSNFGLIGWYLGMVKNRPIVTKSVTSSLIYTAADLSSQAFVGENEEGYDFSRTLRMAGYGMIILGPSLHYWFNFVSRVFPKRDILSTVKKMVLGQAVYGPTMTVTFFSVNAALQGESGSEIVARLKRDVVPAMVSGIMYWPICDFVTFRFIPVHLQPLVSNSFSYLWTIYMTYMASLEKVGSV